VVKALCSPCILDLVVLLDFACCPLLFVVFSPVATVAMLRGLLLVAYELLTSLY
jgi:hypothetical protein